MELKGAFSYLITIVSDFVKDQLIFNLLQDLKGILDDRNKKDIEIKKFILHIGKESSKQICNKVNIQTNINQEIIQQELIKPFTIKDNDVLQPININSANNTPRGQKEIQTSRSSLNTIFQNLQLNERIDSHTSQRKRNVKKLQFILEPNVFTSVNEEQNTTHISKSCEQSKVQTPIKSVIINNHVSKQSQNKILEFLNFTIQDMNNNTIEFLQQNSLQSTQFYIHQKREKTGQLFKPLGKWYLQFKNKQ